MKLRKLCTIAILSAIAAIVMLFEIPLWFAPSFYELDLSEVVVLIGGFALGPVSAVIIEFLKIAINTLINGSTTAYVGELANFVVGCFFVLPATIIYRVKKSKKSAVIGMASGTIILTVAGSLMNLYVLLPMYSYFYKMPIEAFVEMGTKLNSAITDVKTLVLFATAPFNILKGAVSSVITLLLYKKISPILHK